MSRTKTEDFKKDIKVFIDHVESLENSDENGFIDEYLLIQEAQMKSHAENSCLMDIGQLENNLKKNRYKDIVPYDNHRVVLSVLDGDQSSDYINASKIGGVRGTCNYIASQGPLIGTVNDFWRMIWEYNIEIIFMACRLVEMKKTKCHQYWSNLGTSEEFGDITVTTETEEEIKTECIHRKLRVTKGGEVHYVTQFHYCGWPDHGIPENPEDIRDIIGMMRQAKQTNAPLLVHCSAGCGRTGAIIAIDYAWTLLEEGLFDKTFSLFDLICNLRTQRMSLVQTPDQYALVNKVLKSLCEERLAKLSSHTYENVDLKQEDSIKDNHQAPEDSDYEPIWILPRDSQVKSSFLIPEEHSITEERYLGRFEDPEKKSQLADREMDDASSIYANVAEIERKNIKEDRKQRAPSPPSHPESPDLKKGHRTLVRLVASGSIKKPSAAALATNTVSSTAPKVPEVTTFSVAKKESGTQKLQHEKSQPLTASTTKTTRSMSKTLEPPILSAKPKKSQPVADKVTTKRWSSVRSHVTPSQYQYSNTTPTSDTGLYGPPRKSTSPRAPTNNNVFDYSRPPDNRNLTLGGAKGRSLSIKDNQRVRLTSDGFRPEYPVPPKAAVSPTSPKFKGFVRLNSTNPSSRGREHHKQQKRDMFFL